MVSLNHIILLPIVVLLTTAAAINIAGCDKKILDQLENYDVTASCDRDNNIIEVVSDSPLAVVSLKLQGSPLLQSQVHFLNIPSLSISLDFNSIGIQRKSTWTSFILFENIANLEISSLVFDSVSLIPPIDQQGTRILISSLLGQVPAKEAINEETITGNSQEQTGLTYILSTKYVQSISVQKMKLLNTIQTNLQTTNMNALNLQADVITIGSLQISLFTQTIVFTATDRLNILESISFDQPFTSAQSKEQPESFSMTAPAIHIEAITVGAYSFSNPSLNVAALKIILSSKKVEVNASSNDIVLDDDQYDLVIKSISTSSPKLSSWNTTFQIEVSRLETTNNLRVFFGNIASEIDFPIDPYGIVNLVNPLGITVSQASILNFGGILTKNYISTILRLVNVDSVEIGGITSSFSRNIVDNSSIIAIYFPLVSVSWCSSITFKNVAVSNISLKTAFLSLRYVDNIVFSSVQITNSYLDSSDGFLSLDNTGNVSILEMIVDKSKFQTTSLIQVPTKCGFLSIYNFQFKSLQTSRIISYYGTNYLVNVKLANEISIRGAFCDFGVAKMGFMQVNSFNSTTITQSSFRNCYSFTNGGCLFFGRGSKVASELNLINAYFYNSMSAFQGGAIFGGIIKSIIETTFERCNSTIGGAIVYGSGQQMSVFENGVVFLNNYASIKNDDISAMVSKIQVKNIEEFNPKFESVPQLYRIPFNGTEILSGMSYLIQLEVLIEGDTTPVSNFKDNNSAVVNGVHKNNTGLNMFELVQSNNYFDDEVASNANFIYLVFLTDLLFGRMNDFDPIIEMNLSTSSSVFLQLEFTRLSFECKWQDGQVLRTQHARNSFNYCVYCEFNTALIVNSTANMTRSELAQLKCETCNQIAFKTCFANQAVLNAGFWQSEKSITNFEYCSILPSNCNSAENGSTWNAVGNSLCYEGHKGAQCLDCIVENNFTRGGSLGVCTDCNSVPRNEYYIWGFQLGQFLLVGGMVLMHFKAASSAKQREFDENGKWIPFEEEDYEFSKNFRFSMYVKIIIFHYSFLVIQEELTNFNFIGSVFRGHWTVLTPIDQIPVYSLNCYLLDIFNQVNNNAWINLIANLFIPSLTFIAFTSLMVIVYFVQKKPTKNASQAEIQEYIKTQHRFMLSIPISFVILFMLLWYQKLLQICFESFKCLSLDGSQPSVSLFDLSLSCNNSDSHNISSILKYTIPFSIILQIVPIVACIWITKKPSDPDKKNENEGTLMECLGFLYVDYNLKFYYWEFVRFFVRMLYVIGTVFFIQNKIYCGVYVIMIAFVYFIALNSANPFLNSEFNILEKLSIIIAIFSMLSSLSYSTQQNSTDQSQLIESGEIQEVQTNSLAAIAFIFIQCLNLAFIGGVIIRILIVLFPQIFKNIYAFLKRIFKKIYAFLKKIFKKLTQSESERAPEQNQQRSQPVQPVNDQENQEQPAADNNQLSVEQQASNSLQSESGRNRTIILDNHDDNGNLISQPLLDNDQ